ncbi:MAG TPA: hypothetical protein PLL66_09570, partial [Bacteroidales bacterium]|nr:hypothetical protein [Bacteroidales bacterium]
MSFELKHSFFQGIIKASPSKSYEQRILAAGLMSDQGCIIENFGCSDDVIAARKIVSQLGMHCNIDESGKLVCTKAERKDSSFKSLTLDCGESAMCARFFTPITCLYEVPFILSGSGLLLNRPVADSFEVLAQMGCVFKSKDANLPVLFEKSLLKAGKYIIDGSKSSQFISGLVFSMPTLKDDSQLIIHNPVSFNYILLSIDVLKSFGIIIRYKFDKRRNLEINIPGNQEYRSEQIYKVEGDWSGAANFLVAAAVNGKIVIRGLSETSLQPDKSILNVFDIAGVKYFWDKEVLYVEKSRIKAFDFNATDCPDLIPALVVLAAFADG